MPIKHKPKKAAKTTQKKAISTFGLRGVGKQLEKHLARLNIFSPHDLLFHLPYRYQDRTKVQTIREIIPGQEAQIEGVIENISMPAHGRTKLLCELKDGVGKITLRFFHLLSYQKDILKIGSKLRCFSTVRVGPKGLEMIHPEFQVLYASENVVIDQHLTPIYPATEGLSQYMLRKLTTNALQWMQHQSFYDEILPNHLLTQFSFPCLQTSIQFVHRPHREVLMDELLQNKTAAQKRLAFDELLAHRISLLSMKQKFKSETSVAVHPAHQLSARFINNLSFELTAAQKRVMQEITSDLMQAHPMLRLVQGDVGAGKTVIAALSMLQVIESGYQAALMVPTELLAEQHFKTLSSWCKKIDVSVALLTGHVKGVKRREALSDIENGTAQIVIGTHALFQDEVNFQKLALVVIDEQHRFGVEQRALLRKKGIQQHFFPHQLMMTATPIPRTLAMSFYADLDCSQIDELPPGRTPVVTTVISSARRNDVIARVKEACLSGKQTYWVCPLIEESEMMDCQSAIQTTELLQQQLPELKIDLIHGRMSSEKKEAAMRGFQAGQTHLLVATTVIEVGVDVPNASLMVIENAERLGLSQLHQLRGRVGRGSVESHCVLFYQHPLSDLAKERLAVMKETTDGFKIAQRDLELRGPGEVLGTKQTGALAFRVADLMRDSELLPSVQEAANLIMRDYPHHIKPILTRWIPKHEEYGKI